MSTKEFFVKSARWIIVLPASFVIMNLASYLWGLGFLLIDARYIEPTKWNFWITLIYTKIMSSFVGVFAYMYSGVFIVPNYKKETAFALCLLLCAFSAIAFILVNFFSKKYLSNVEIVTTFLACIYCYNGIKNQY